MNLTGIDEKEKFIERELSWLAFNERVLEEAIDPQNPLLEQIKFLAIAVSNLDEFFMVRVAGLLNLIDSGYNRRDPYGYYPQELYREIRQRSEQLIARVYEVYKQRLKDLKEKDIEIQRFQQLNREQQKFVRRYFDSTLYPIITPMAVDPGHPFPVLPSQTIAFAVSVIRKSENYLAIIPIPKNIPRLVKLPAVKSEVPFILLEDIIREHLPKFFKGYRLAGQTVFRIIRDSELMVDEEFAPDLLRAIDQEVKKRTRARIVYMAIEKSTPDDLTQMLCNGLSFSQDQVIPVENDLDLTYLFSLYQNVYRPELCYPGYVPAKIPYENIFQRISEGDFITHVPYQSFYPTIDLIAHSAQDPDVLAIKMTLYRTNSNSAIIQALKEAARNGKQVTVLVEIKARFDEENNIRWSRELENEGCHVIYGIPGLKIHSKMTMIVRREEGQIKRYIHLSTGNYNENTAHVYTDIGYFTANEDFAKDISDVFNIVTGYSMPSPGKRIITSPKDMRQYFLSLIDREIYFQKHYRNGRIDVKMNSLEDPQTIEKLYEASQAGVKINLIVRGICCLIPGIKNMSDHIQVRSIVGRFLEHSRIFIFNNNTNPRIFLSSADWMRRNFDRRIELLFEVSKEDIKQHLMHIMNLFWKDNTKARILGSNRIYARPACGQAADRINLQEYLMSYYEP